jgi:hypothetical protein
MERAFWNRRRRLIERFKHVNDARHAAIGQKGELDHTQFDDFISRGIEAGCLDVEQNAGLSWLFIAWYEFNSRDQAA